LNNKLSWSAGRFLDFLLHSGTRYRIHSPFLYAFTDEVIRKDRHVPGSESIEKARKECLSSREIIRKTDYGTGGDAMAGITYPVKISTIASASLTSPKHARRLYRLARYIKAESILEIGTSLGITTAYLSLANPGARIITLEGCPELCRKAGENFNKLGIENIEIIEGRFEDTLEKALEKLGGADLVIIDGNHRGEALKAYFECTMHYVKNDSVVICDDIHSSEEMEKAWEEIIRDERTRISLDLFKSGWVLFRKESSREHFKLRYI
jgi:predicted O-methyltransferase YrrM